MASSPHWVPTSDPTEVELEPFAGDRAENTEGVAQWARHPDCSPDPLSRHSSPYRHRSHSVSPRPVEESFPGQLYTPLESWPSFMDGFFHHTYPLATTPPASEPTAQANNTYRPARSPSVVSESQTEPESLLYGLEGQLASAKPKTAPTAPSPCSIPCPDVHAYSPSIHSKSQSQSLIPTIPTLSMFPASSISAPPSLPPSLHSSKSIHHHIQHLDIEIEALEGTIAAAAEKDGDDSESSKDGSDHDDESAEGEQGHTQEATQNPPPPLIDVTNSSARSSKAREEKKRKEKKKDTIIFSDESEDDEDDDEDSEDDDDEYSAKDSSKKSTNPGNPSTSIDLTEGTSDEDSDDEAPVPRRRLRSSDKTGTDSHDN